jgi:transposase
MAPILFHGLNQLGLPVVCVESRQASQALKSLATHKTDRSDTRGLAHLARTGFFKPVHVKSLSAHAVRALISARKNRGRVRDPTATRADRRLHRSGSPGKRGDRWSLRHHAWSDCGTDRSDDGGRGDRR